MRQQLSILPGEAPTWGSPQSLYNSRSVLSSCTGAGCGGIRRMSPTATEARGHRTELGTLETDGGTSSAACAPPNSTFYHPVE